MYIYKTHIYIELDITSRYGWRFGERTGNVEISRPNSDRSLIKGDGDRAQADSRKVHAYAYRYIYVYIFISKN